MMTESIKEQKREPKKKNATREGKESNEKQASSMRSVTSIDKT